MVEVAEVVTSVVLEESPVVVEVVNTVVAVVVTVVLVVVVVAEVVVVVARVVVALVAVEVTVVVVVVGATQAGKSAESVVEPTNNSLTLLQKLIPLIWLFSEPCASKIMIPPKISSQKAPFSKIVLICEGLT